MDLGVRLELLLCPVPRMAYELQQICRVCRRPVASEGAHPEAIVELAHAVNGTCPCCGQAGPAEPDRNYRRRARRWIARMARKRARERDAGAS